MRPRHARGADGRRFDHLGIGAQRAGRPPIGWSLSPEVAAALAEAEGAARGLDARLRDYRAQTLASVVPGKLTAAEAFARVGAARRLDRITHHAWRSAAHLLGRGGEEPPR